MNKTIRFPLRTLVSAVLALAAGAALADINVGVTVSATGPAASLGIPEKNTIALLPQTIGGQKVHYIVLDDGSDTTKAVSNTRKLITEDKVDIVLGSTVTPNSLAMIDVVSEAQVPMISMAASAKIVDPVDAKRRWVFKTPQNDIQMSLAIASHMRDHGVKTVGYIGFADAYGEAGTTSSRRRRRSRASPSSPTSASRATTPRSPRRCSSCRPRGPTPS